MQNVTHPIYDPALHASGGRDLLREASGRVLRSVFVWLSVALLAFRLTQFVGRMHGDAATDFLAFYYAAKLIGQVDIYDHAAFKQAILTDAEYPALPKLPQNLIGFAPAPPPIYPPPSFYLFKVFVPPGYLGAIAWHRWLLPVFAWLTAAGAGVLAAQLLRRAALAPLVAGLLLCFYIINPYIINVATLGQLNLYVAAGMAWGLALAGAFPATAACMLVVTILLKPSGWLVGLPLLWFWRRQWRALLPAAGLALVLMVLPGWGTWQHYLASARSGSIHYWVAEHAQEQVAPNSALKPIAMAIGGGPAQQALLYYGGMLLYLSLWGVIAWAFVRGRLALGAAAAASMLLSFLLGPVSWNEHVVFMAPFLMLALLAAYEGNRRAGLGVVPSLRGVLALMAGTYAFCFSYIIWPPGALGRLNVLMVKAWHLLAAAGLLALALAAARLLLLPRRQAT